MDREDAWRLVGNGKGGLEPAPQSVEPLEELPKKHGSFPGLPDSSLHLKRSPERSVHGKPSYALRALPGSPSIRSQRLWTKDMKSGGRVGTQPDANLGTAQASPHCTRFRGTPRPRLARLLRSPLRWTAP